MADMAGFRATKHSATSPRKRRRTPVQSPRSSPVADRSRGRGPKRPRFKEKEPENVQTSPKVKPRPEISLLDSSDSDSDAIGIRAVAAETGLMGNLLAAAARPVETIYETVQDSESQSVEDLEVDKENASSTLESVASAQGEHDWTSEEIPRIVDAAPSPELGSSEPIGSAQGSIAPTVETPVFDDEDLGPEWTASRAQLVTALSKEHGLLATTLGEFIQDHGVDIQGPENSAGLHLALTAYIVSPKNGHCHGPSAMPRSHQALCNADQSTEEFLYQLWNAVYPRVEATSLNAELHTGPWYDLAECIGREWVTYIILHCHVFRPWLVGAGADSSKQHWLHLVGKLNWNQAVRHGSPKTESRKDLKKDFMYLSKADIMYKKTPLGRVPLNPEMRFGDETIGLPAFTLEMENLMTGGMPLKPTVPTAAARSKLPARLVSCCGIIAKRFAQYNSQLACHRIPLPKPLSAKHRWTPHREVVGFVLRRVKKLVPVSFLGSKNNWSVFEAAVLKFVKATGFSKLAVKPLLKGLKPSEMEWRRAVLDDPSVDSSLADSIAEICVCILFDSVVKPLLEHHFYITEMSGDPRSVFYFEKTVWLREFDRPTRLDLVKRHFLRPRVSAETSEAEMNARAEEYLSAKRHGDGQLDVPYSTTHWRVVPKRDGSSRPIINLKELNATSRDTHAILLESMRPVPSRLASWQSWITRLYQYRATVTAAKPTKCFYSVQLDISGCYDNANMAKVKELIQQNLDNGNQNYRLQSVRTYTLDPQRKSGLKRVVKRLPDRAVHEELRRTNNTKEDGHNTNEDGEAAGSAFVVQETPTSEIVPGPLALRNATTLFKNLEFCVAPYSSIDFTQGIPQGSSCSLDLCNMLLDDLVEQKLGKFTSDPQSLLLRYVDDFLFVTTDKSLATNFRETMLEGFQDEYGVTCNVSKVRSNLHTSHPYRLHFLGYDFDAKSLDVYPRKVTPSFSMHSKRSDLLKRQLAYELDYMLSALRGFKRQRICPPAKLVRETAVEFGAALASRLDAFMQLYNRTPDQDTRPEGTRAQDTRTQVSITQISRSQAYNRAVNQYMMPLVPSEHDTIRRIIRQSYAREKRRVS